MSWQQVSPKLWQRPLGENERMIKWIGDRAHQFGREQWSVTAVADFAAGVPNNREIHSDSGSGISLSTETLRRAWVRLRFSHPGIASSAGADTLEYTVPDASSLKQWVDETLSIISDPAVTVSGVVENYIKPSPFVTGCFLPHTQQFVLHTAHWRADGPGILQLLDAFFNALSSELTEGDVQLPWGEEPNRLPPSVEEALDIPTDPTPEIRTATTACLATGRLVVGSIGLPYQNSEVVPGATHWVRHSFSHEDSTAILAACQNKGVRPLAAVHASLAAANVEGSRSLGGSDVPTTVVESHYTSTMRFSLRPYLPANHASAAPALFTGNYMSAVPTTCSWPEMAARYEALYAEGLSPDFLMARRQFAHEAFEMLQRMAAANAPAGPGGPPQRSEIDISSVDNAERLIAPRHHGENTGLKGKDEAEVQVKSIALGIECLTKETYLFFWVFRGRLELNLVYNEVFYESGFMEKMLHKVEESLLTGLEVRSSSG